MLQKPISTLPGIGPKTKTKLEKLKINTVGDLLHHYPRHYQDFSKLTTISSLKENLPTTIKIKILNFNNQYRGRNLSIQRVLVEDQTGRILVTWFNQPFLQNVLKPGTLAYLSGTPSLFRQQIQFNSPDYELMLKNKNTLHTKRIVPVYPSTTGLNSKWFRKTINQALHLSQKTIDFLPPETLKKHHLLSLKTALKQIHRPSTQNSLQEARKRIGLNEVFSLQLSSYLKKKSWSQQAPRFKLSLKNNQEKTLRDFIKSLPFPLTKSQTKTWKELKKDLLSSKVTNRLLQGDVGSGKTVIALLGSLLSVLNGHFSLILVPTNILAQQHHRSFKNFLKKLDIPVYLLTSKEKAFLKKKAPPSGIIISTQAAFFQPKLQKKDIAFLVIDEQHRFGVKQRAFLTKNKSLPHILTMTATPIPRTMHLAFLSWLDVSSIDQISQNKRQIQSQIVPEKKRSIFYQWINQKILSQKQQLLVICPLIDRQESENPVRSAKEEFEKLKKLFPEKKTALIHGKIKKGKQEKILEKMHRGEIDILVSTSVIEVGIDLPKTTAIVIENAELFGLAQLHQLRGRVGRRGQESYCFLFSEQRSERLLNFLKTEDGLKLAQKDLKLRGPGLLFDTAQHGFPQFKVAHPYDLDLIKLSRLIIKELSVKNLLPSINQKNDLALN